MDWHIWGNEHSRYLVQIVDNAGNVAEATNKGTHYAPVAEIESLLSSGCVGNCSFLPVVMY